MSNAENTNTLHNTEQKKDTVLDKEEQKQEDSVYYTKNQVLYDDSLGVYVDEEGFVLEEVEDAKNKEKDEDNETKQREDDEESFTGVVPIQPIIIPDTIEHLFEVDDDGNCICIQPDYFSEGGSYRLSAKRPYDDAATERIIQEQRSKRQKMLEVAMSKEPIRRLNEEEEEAFFHGKPAQQDSANKDIPSQFNASARPKDVSPSQDNVPTRPTDASSSPPPPSFSATIEGIKLDRAQEERVYQAMAQTTQSLTEDQWNDPLIVAEYASDIFCHLLEVEADMMADPDYVDTRQHEVSWRVRGVLLDWLVEIHETLGLLPETLFLCVNLIDRFLSRRAVALGKMQLVGITCLYLATKIEEIACPSIEDFVKFTEKAVTPEDVLKAERFILQNLDFRVSIANPMDFLRRISTKELECDVHTKALSKYLLESTILDHRFIGVRPSMAAAASLWVARKMLAKGKWSPKHTRLTGYSPVDLKPVVMTMLDHLARPITHQAFFEKWSVKEYSKASIFARDWINRYYLE